mgnify:CR=1 FL=1
MAGLNRTEAYFSGLKVHNNGNNILEMNSNGSFSLKSNSLLNNSKNNIKNIANLNNEVISMNGNVILKSNNGNIILQNGNEKINYNIKEELENQNLSETKEEDIYFLDLDDVNNLRDDSLLIESLNKPLCLYGNQGINNITHNNYKVISDKEIIFQALKKIRFNTMGTLSINTEKIIGSCEEDIILISNEGNIKLGGDGLDGCALTIQNNKILFGKSLKFEEDKKVVINVENNRDGIKLIGENVNPELEIENDNAKLICNLGIQDNDINNIFFAKIINSNNKTIIETLDNFEFCLDDIGNLIHWGENKMNIINFISKYRVEINETINDKDFIKCFINRNNCGNIKTVSNSNLHLGTNDLDILNISKNGRIGVNTKNIEGSFHITNNYGKVNNIRREKNKVYFKHKIIQLENSNFIIFANSVENEKYSLEAFLYNIDNNLLKHEILKKDSFVEIEFSIILHPKNKNFIILALCYFTEDALFMTEVNLYTHILRRKKGFTKKIINEDIEKSSYPFLLSHNDNHILVYRDFKDREETYLKVFGENNEVLKLLVLNEINNISEVIIDGEKLAFISNNNLFQVKLLEDFSYQIEDKIEIKENYIFNKIIFYQEKVHLFSINENNIIYEDKVIIENIDSDARFNLANNSLEIIYKKNDKIIIFDLVDKVEIELFESNINNIILTNLVNTKNKYIKSLISVESKNVKSFNGNSIIFVDHNSNSNLLKVSNNFNQIEVKDNGDILFEDLIEFSKKKNVTQLKNNLVLSEIKDLDKVAKQGQINYYENNLLVYLGNKWKKIKLEDF